MILLGRSFSRGCARNGFSLVEVVVAIGIVAVALIGIFVLVQTGFKTYRDAMNSTVTSSIAQQMISQYILADFDSLAGNVTLTNYFDERGLLLSMADTSRAIYIATGMITNGPVAGVDPSRLCTVQVKITSPTQPEFHRDFISYLARQGAGGH